MKTLYKNKPAKDISKLKEKFFVLDVETWTENGKIEATPDKFVFGCMVGHNYRKIFHSVEEFKNEFKKKQFRHKYIFAHNAEFDFSVIFGNVLKNLDRKAVFNGGFVLAKQGTTHFADSMKIFPHTSVKILGKNLGLDKLDMPNKYTQGNQKYTVDEIDIEYCYRDCDIVYKSLLAMFETVGSVKVTLASLALQMYRNHFQPYHITYNEKLCNKFFDSYYGGRVECLKIGDTHSEKYDVNSMYPFAMLNCKFPNPAYLKVEKNISLEKFKFHLKYHEGLARVTVKHRKENFGFLPLKKDKKLIFPSGIFRGTWNLNELKFAIDKKVIEVIGVQEIIYGPRMDTPFKEWVTEIYKRRKESTGIYVTINKNLLNNLYGKFAQREKFEEHYFEETPLDFIGDLLDKNVKHEVHYFNEHRKDCYVKVECRQKTRYHTIALFSSYITSFARIHLLKLMLQHEKNIITYLDTDCIALEKPIPGFKNSLELGDFKLEEDKILKIYGNKSYKFSKGLETGKKLKGIPKKALEINENTFIFDTMRKTKGAIRTEKITGESVTITKNLRFNYEKREPRKTGFTRILNLQE